MSPKHRGVCPLTPTPHETPPPPAALECGHCDGYIVAGMHVGYCPIHEWLCDQCAALHDTTEGVTP